MEAYAGIDLHSTNNYIGVIDANDKRLYSRRHENQLKHVLKALGPFKRNLKGVVVESTYNWYWLVDGLREHGFKVHLANPSAIKTYEGLKHTDDKWDSFWLAHLLRLAILSEGYIYPKEQRPIRDLLRRRLMFVRHRTAQILSLQSMISRICGLGFPGNAIKEFNIDFIGKLFDSYHHQFTAERNLLTINFLGSIIKEIETEVKSQIQLREDFKMLLTTPGIGLILGLTIMLEVGDIKRFPKVGITPPTVVALKARSIQTIRKKAKTTRKTATDIWHGPMWKQRITP